MRAPDGKARLVVGVALVATLVAAGCKKSGEATPEAAVANVQVAHPTVGPIAEQITADAILAPLSQAALASRISAPVRAEYVQRGAHVHRGQLLLTLEDRDLQGNALDTEGAVRAAEANLTATVEATIPEELKKAEGDFEQAKAARDVAVRAAEERRKLFGQGALSGREADASFATAVQAQTQLDDAQKHLDAVRGTTGRTNRVAAQSQLTSARGRLTSAEAQVGYASLRSPIDGVVTDRPLFPGETAAAGTTVITVMDTSSLLAKLHLGQASAQQLSLGHEAMVTVPGVEEPMKAAVSFISPALDPGSTTVEVWLKLPNPRGLLKVGTPVHAVIGGNTTQNALQVPAGAILPATDGGTVVMVVGPEGAAHRRAVKLGVRTPEVVQVVSGLAVGDTVITEGGYGLDDGAKVAVGKPGEDAGSAGEGSQP